MSDAGSEIQSKFEGPEPAKARALRLNAKDDVACLMQACPAGATVEVVGAEGGVIDVLEARQDIPRFHKIALRDMVQGGEVHKYGEVIGVASRDIARGDYVHTHNVVSAKVGAGA